MKHQVVTNERTARSYWFWSLVLLVGSWMIVVAAYERTRIEDVPYSEYVLLMVVLSPLVPLCGLVLRLRNRFVLRRRQLALKAYAAKAGLKLRHAVDSKKYLEDIALREVFGARTHRVRNVIEGDDWTYSDWSYDLYRDFRDMERKTSTVYYGVMATTLPRRLPHVFFDSRKARRRQFRFHFAGSQIHRLEGGFEQHFDVYFPKGYTIDAMSFISPDVMWALQEAEDYDIEIVGNQLILYSPLYDPTVQVRDMAVRLKRIKKELLDNILTYRDQRLPYEQGRHSVAPLGAKLQGNLFWGIVALAFMALYLAFWIWGLFVD